MCRNAHDFFVVSDTLITFMACNINDKLMTVTDRFLKYVTFDTESSETTGVTPSTPGQRVFAEALVKELEEIGLEDITLDDKSYLPIRRRRFRRSDLSPIWIPVLICQARMSSRVS
jgi:tripeptide aminopeptidase